MQLIDIFNLSLLGRRDEIAIEFEDENGKAAFLTFGELDTRSSQLANLFASRGLKRGDRLGFFLSNRVEIIDIFLACVKTGIIIVPINILYRTRELAHIVEDAAPKAVITTGETASLIPSATAVWNAAEISKSALEFDKTFERMAIDGDDAAAIVYTSGTTGRSKGAILTHNNLAANAINLCACWQITNNDRYLAVLPLFHVHGLGNGIACWLLSGCRMRLLERFDIKTTPEIFESFEPTLFFGVPTVYVRLLELPDERARRIGERMRLFVCGSAPLPANILEEFRQKFGHTILERYGMSETLMNLSNPFTGERRAGSVGFPLPGVSVKIVDSDLKPVKGDEIGELLVRGANVCAGYWNRPDANEEAFVGGWFRTGDLAQKSSDGYFTLCGRRSELIISGGFNIYPREIEEFLLEQKGVREATVCGISDRKRGEIPIAYIVTDENFDDKTIEESCRRAFASFKIPRAFIRVENLPRNALGKVQKHLLPAWRTE